MSNEENEMTDSIKLEGEVTKGEDNVSQKLQSSPSVSNDTNLTEKKEVSNNTPAILTREDIAALDYTDFSTPARMLELGKVLVKSKLVTGKQPEDVVVSLMAGRELGLPFVVSLSQIYPIDGKPSLGVHLIKGLILKNKILFEKIEDSAPIYTFAVIKDDGKPDPETATLETIQSAPEGYKRGNTIKGYRTKYKFTREMKMPSGTYKEQIAYGSFSTIEAAEAELLDKTNWKRYWRRMLDARAFSIGAREIADDIINGMLTPDELGANSYINSSGEEVIEDIPHTEA